MVQHPDNTGEGVHVLLIDRLEHGERLVHFSVLTISCCCIKPQHAVDRMTSRRLVLVSGLMPVRFPTAWLPSDTLW